MDILLWSNQRPELKVLDTRKLFYGQFLHKSTYKVETDWRLSSYYSFKKNISNNHCEYHIFSNLRDCSTVKIKMRIEKNFISIFCNDLEYLYDLDRNTLSKFRLLSITTVLSKEKELLLNQNFILVKKPTDYLYKINFRDGVFRNLHERVGLANYLENLGDEVKVTKKYLQELRSSNKYIRTGFIYVKDHRLVDIVSLINHQMIRSVQQLVVT